MKRSMILVGLTLFLLGACSTTPPTTGDEANTAGAPRSPEAAQPTETEDEAATGDEDKSVGAGEFLKSGGASVGSVGEEGEGEEGETDDAGEVDADDVAP
jgi:hypothetical protein